jgi:hypothetical protein
VVARGNKYDGARAGSPCTQAGSRALRRGQRRQAKDDAGSRSTGACSVAVGGGEWRETGLTRGCPACGSEAA